MPISRHTPEPEHAREKLAEHSSASHPILDFGENANATPRTRICSNCHFGRGSVTFKQIASPKL
jgi:hypothetical protein